MSVGLKHSSAAPSPFIGQASSIVTSSVALALLCSALHVVLALGLQRCSPSIRALSAVQRSDLIVNIMWLLTCTPIPFLYAASLMELWGTGLEGRWLNTSFACEIAMLLHVASSLYELGVYVVYSRPAVYFAHHLIVVCVARSSYLTHQAVCEYQLTGPLVALPSRYAYGLGLWIGAMHFWAAWDGLTEASNINLCLLKVGLILNLGRGSLPEIINGGYVARRRPVLWPLSLSSYCLLACRPSFWPCALCFQLRAQLVCGMTL